MTDFDDYVADYRDIINRVSMITGEDYEFFIRFRLDVLQEQLGAQPGLSEPMKILDFGCGIGTTEAYLRQRFPCADIWGVDTSPESIRAATSLNLPGVRFVTGKGIDRFLSNGDFELIYSNGTFHHLPEGEHPIVLRKLFQSLRKGGNLFIFENNPCNPLMMRAMRNNPFDTGAIPLRPSYLKRLALDAGFPAVAIGYYFFFPKAFRFLRLTERYLRWLPIGAQYFIRLTK